MVLQLFLNEKLVGEVPFDEDRYDEAYLIGKKLLLQDIFREQIEKSKARCTFYINTQSKMNTSAKTLLTDGLKKALP